ncbi:ABC transporter ATP-binding protein [Pleomorphomonas diazotrophica]|uniref:ABC transporter ATP-binding protein n=1 Tax=Pleomorphomonas diazotrophica TaxID=1166257 RepID=A0A1I4S667_9HYPH|nr:ABC transporter ATP-binding protein [Pleomorphomonas diazotrophica]PKR89931.1 ABC transporter ATP-binding protein [Pleomorphomonas diazotrophica]SFM59784.1 carbohydrate ABC transporter ATP-binding protein, CUT1 family [Pleomorphomonas diazotrophica]
MSSVSLQNLEISYGNVPIVKNLDLTIEDGEFLVLLGPSGCGKSTLLSAIGGLADVSGGRILFNDKDVTWTDPKDRGIGMVFQSYALYPTMSVERNLSFGLRIAGIDRAIIEKKVKWAADLLQITHLLDRKPSALSGGQRQRVAIGRALVRDADIFLFDEPLSNLDAKLRAELRLEIKKLHKTLKSTMIYVTHDQIEALTLADRIAVMKDGIIQQLDTPLNVYNKPANEFVGSFLGSPAMNKVEGKIVADGDRLVFVAGDFRLDVSRYPFAQKIESGRPAVLGLRPEHILPAKGEAQAIEGKVSLIEPMGSSILAWSTFDGISLSHLVGQDDGCEADSTFPVTIDIQKASFFDVGTGWRL